MKIIWSAARARPDKCELFNGNKGKARRIQGRTRKSKAILIGTNVNYWTATRAKPDKCELLNGNKGKARRIQGRTRTDL